MPDSSHSSDEDGALQRFHSAEEMPEPASVPVPVSAVSRWNHAAEPEPEPVPKLEASAAPGAAAERFHSARELPIAETDIRLQVGGISCGGCVKSVEGALLALDGVSSAKVELGGSAKVRAAGAEASELVAAVEALGKSCRISSVLPAAPDLGGVGLELEGSDEDDDGAGVGFESGGRRGSMVDVGEDGATPKEVREFGNTPTASAERVGSVEASTAERVLELKSGQLKDILRSLELDAKGSTASLKERLLSAAAASATVADAVARHPHVATASPAAAAEGEGGEPVEMAAEHTAMFDCLVGGLRAPREVGSEERAAAEDAFEAFCAAKFGVGVTGPVAMNLCACLGPLPPPSMSAQARPLTECVSRAAVQPLDREELRGARRRASVLTLMERMLDSDGCATAFASALRRHALPTLQAIEAHHAQALQEAGGGSVSVAADGHHEAAGEGAVAAALSVEHERVRYSAYVVRLRASGSRHRKYFEYTTQWRLGTGRYIAHDEVHEPGEHAAHEPSAC